MPKRLPTKLEVLVSHISCFTLSAVLGQSLEITSRLLKWNWSILKKYIFVIILGLPAVIVALSLGIAAGKDGVQSFVSDK